jgi:molybdenum cofactor synthesis domain-containing protein
MSFNTNHNNNFVELFAIGNELLVGQVLDTNTHWLVRNLTAAGAQVRRAAMIRDDYDDIGEQLLGALARKPRLIVTTGGLGPTDDDMTYRAISRALKLELYEDANALEMIRKRYAYLATIRPNFNAELNDARRKMALFPRGAEVLANNAGAAPALALEVGETTLVSLPGVPVEMKDIYSNSLQPVLARTIGTGGYVERNIVLDLGDESRIAAALEQVQARHTTVYIKSRGQTVDGERRLTVVLSRGGSDLIAIRDEINATEQEALDGLKQLGYTILKVFESE